MPFELEYYCIVLTALISDVAMRSQDERIKYNVGTIELARIQITDEETMNSSYLE